MEQAAKGLRPADKVLDSVRGALELAGMEGHIPSVREYLEAFPKLAREQSERNRRRSFKVFLEFLGADADKRLDKINHTRCRDFVRWALGQVSRKTVQQYYTYVSGAFKRAVEVDDLLNKNPMAGVSVATEAASVIPEKGEDKQKREPFTCEEVIYLMSRLPEPWCSMVAVCVYTGGLRISDVCLMRWDSINWKDGLIHLIEQKTRKERIQPIIPALRRVLERLKQQPDAHDEYVFPDMAVYFNTGAGGRVSTMFTDLLRAHGLIKVTFAKKEGRRHTIVFNSTTVVRDIPLEAYDYIVNGKSAIEWVMERYAVTTDKDSGIVNDPNLWCEEHDDPEYIINLLLRVITVSLETVKIVNSLPPMEIID